MSAAARRGRRRRRALGAGVRAFLVVGVWGALAVAGVLAWYGADLPATDSLDATALGPRVTILASDGAEIGGFGGLRAGEVALTELSPALLQAVIATEDRRFRRHFGIDVIAILRATLANAFSGRIRQGGSTITQQLAKNLFLSPERTFKRKVKEALLAFSLERRFSKDEILGLYLNRVYLGAGAWGVEAAARTYFGKSARAVSLAEAAMLAGLLKAPSRYAPSANPEGARERAAVVLGDMVEAGFITAEAAAAAQRTPAGAVKSALGQRGSRYFADWIVNRLPGYLGGGGGDLRVATTLDRRLQRAAESALGAALAEAPGGAQGALIAMSPDGAVRAMVGGRSYAQGPFNRAVNATRQPGSAFKLFVYLAGLEAGLTPDDVIEDRPVDVEGWRPRNYSGAFVGAVSLREAFARSINTVAVRVSERAGRHAVIEVAARLGISGEIAPHPSIALGAAEVNLIELTAAYGALANGGNAILPYGVVEIRDGGDGLAYRRQGSGLGRAIGGREVALMTEMLEAAIAEGTGRAAALDRPAGGKTGTSQDFRDAWFIGFTADLVAGVWVGNDDSAPMPGVTGGTLPARIWRAFMTAAHEGLPKRPL